jgi:heterodisulfide reductase subunit A
VLAHPLIEVHTRAELTGVRGYVGDFEAEITVQSRGVADAFTHFEEAEAACPVEVPDEHNYGLSTRKAIYRAYPDAYPRTPAIDWEHCDNCGECLKVNGTGLDLTRTEKTFTLNVGAFVVATGFQPYQPREGEFGYGQYPEVITLPQLIRLLALTKEGEPLTWQGRKVHNVALIHCVGSREIPGVHEPQPDGEVKRATARWRG